MFYILSQILATVFRAGGGMIAKDSERVKMLVSLGNLGWLISGALTANVPLVVSNAVCLFNCYGGRDYQKQKGEAIMDPMFWVAVFILLAAIVMSRDY